MNFEVKKLRIRIPNLKLWDKEPNNARFGRYDLRFLIFYIKEENLFIYPDYSGNPHEGDDLGLIKLNEHILEKITNHVSFLNLPKSVDFPFENHLGMIFCNF